MNELTTFNDIFKYKSVSFKIVGIEYDIMKKEDVEKIPCLSVSANILGNRYNIDYILKENAKHIYNTNGNYDLADACIQKANDIIEATHRYERQNNEKKMAHLNISTPADCDNITYTLHKKEYATTLMLWGHSCAFEYKENPQYPSYYQYECGLSNPQKLQEELLREGFYRDAAFCEIFETYTVNELKIIADSIGISKNGKKTDLIQRILCNSHPDELHAHIRDKRYLTLSDKGKSYLQQHKDYVVFHKYGQRFCITLKDYVTTKKKLLTTDCETILIEILHQRIQKNCFDTLSHLHLETLYNNTKQFDKAMMEFLINLYFNLNCVTNFSWYNSSLEYCTFEKAKEDMLNRAYPFDYLQLEHAAYFSKNYEYFKKDFVDFIYDHYSLRHIVTEKQLFLRILDEMKTNAVFDCEKWNDLIYENYIYVIKNL